MIANVIADNIPVIIGAVVAIVVPGLTFARWLMGRRHTEEIEDTTAMSEAIGAITDANVQIAAVVQTLIQPLREEVARINDVATEQAKQIALQDLQIVSHVTEMERQAAVERQQAMEIGAMRAEMEAMQGRMTALIHYVNILRKQVSDSGMEPHPIPPNIDLSDFNFD
jgi:vacuolar-type H+-ATPase subunit F/Vma7